MDVHPCGAGDDGRKESLEIRPQVTAVRLRRHKGDIALLRTQKTAKKRTARAYLELITCRAGKRKREKRPEKTREQRELTAAPTQE